MDEPSNNPWDEPSNNPWLEAVKPLINKPESEMSEREKLIRFGVCTPEQADTILANREKEAQEVKEGRLICCPYCKGQGLFVTLLSIESCPVCHGRRRIELPKVSAGS